MVRFNTKILISVLLILSIIDVWAYGASAQVSLPLPPPPLLQGVPQLPAPPGEPSAAPTLNPAAPNGPESPTTIEGSLPPNPEVNPAANPPSSQPAPTTPIQPLIPAPAGQTGGPSLLELEGMIGRLDNRLANLEEQTREGPQGQIPGVISTPFSLTILLLVNAVTFALVI